MAALVMFTSCNKNKDDKDPATIEGIWKGTYVDDATGETLFFSLYIKPNGVIEELDETGQVIGMGEWQLDAATNVFTAKYEWNSNGQDFSIIAAFYPNDAKLLGNWGYDNSNTDGGTFELEELQSV